MKKIVTSILLIAVTFVVNGQDDGKGTIDAQRPTLTESYSIVVPKVLQFENGFDYFDKSSTSSFGTFLRGSVTNRIELRVFTDYKHLNSVGAKFVVIDPESTASQIGASIMYNRDLVNNADEYKVALTKSFEKIFITYNFGYKDAIYNIILLGIPLNKEFNYFIEYYNDASLNRVHSGLTWIPHRDIQFDISGGWMENDGWYSGLGISFRLKK